MRDVLPRDEEPRGNTLYTIQDVDVEKSSIRACRITTPTSKYSYATQNQPPPSSTTTYLSSRALGQKYTKTLIQIMIMITSPRSSVRPYSPHKLLCSSYHADEDSPYPEVRSAVANFDDPSMPASTIRAWVLGVIWAMVIPGMNQFFYFRYPSVTVTGVRHSPYKVTPTC